jgi:hypothetical protein
MNTQDFSVSFLVDQTPEEVFKAIINVRGWWIDEIDGNSEELDDEFEVHFWDIHHSRQKLVELVPGKKVVWLVTKSQLNFLKDKSEWTGTKIIFDIAKKDGKTQMTFTHHGLVPAIECYRDCSPAWTGYISKSLFNLITTGKGEPTSMKAEKSQEA